MVFQRFRQHVPTLIGAALLSLVVDGFILVYRLIGLARPIAVYAGLLTFVVFGSLLCQWIFRPRNADQSGEDNHA